MARAAFKGESGGARRPPPGSPLLPSPPPPPPPPMLPMMLLGPNSIEIFQLEFRLEKPLEFWLDIPYIKNMFRNG